MSYDGKPNKTNQIIFWNAEKYETTGIEPKILINSIPTYQSTYINTFFSDFVNITQGLAPFVGAGLFGGSIANTNECPIGRIGVVRLNTGTLASGSAYIAGGSFVPGNGLEFRYRADILVPTASNVTNRYSVVAGLSDPSLTTLASFTDGVYFQYTDSINSEKWICVTRNAGVTSSFNTDISGSQSSFQTLEFKIDSTASTASFYHNGVFLGDLTSNIPKTVNRVTNMTTFISKSTGTTNRFMNVDFIGIRIERTNPV